MGGCAYLVGSIVLPGCSHVRGKRRQETAMVPQVQVRDSRGHNKVRSRSDL